MLVSVLYRRFFFSFTYCIYFTVCQGFQATLTVTGHLHILSRKPLHVSYCDDISRPTTPFSEAKCPRFHDLSGGTYCTSVPSLRFQFLDMPTHHLPLS